MKKFKLLALSTFMAASFSAGAINMTQYYQSLDGLSGAELKTAISEICRDHFVLLKSSITSTYDNLKETFRLTDYKMIDGEPYWWDMYSLIDNPLTMTFGECKYQREHAFPKSWWKDESQSKSVEYTTAYCDMHHLYPSNGSANASKSNWPLGEVGTKVNLDNGAVKTGSPRSGLIYGIDDIASIKNVFEPADEYKGDFARAYMYVATTYQDLTWNEESIWMVDRNTYPTFTPWAQDMILRWARMDAVSQKETDRNDAVEEIQKNRNPFIDLPNLFEYVWGDSINRPLNIATTVKSASDEAGLIDMIYYNQSFTDGDNGGCTTQNIINPGFNVWSRSDDYGWKGAAYRGKAYEARARLITPEIDLTQAKSAFLTFRHALNQVDPGPMRVFVLNSQDDDFDITEEVTWPTKQSWTFIESGKVDLTKYVNDKIRIAFEYNSTTTTAGTWEIKDVRVEGKEPASVEAVEVDDSNAPVEYYNIYGQRVPETYHGIAIRRQGSTVTKVLLR